MENMGQVITLKRKEKELTQKELADKLGVTDKAVSKWERGISYPDIALIMPLAEVLGLSTDELLGKKEEAKANLPMEDNEEKENRVVHEDRKPQGAVKPHIIIKKGLNGKKTRELLLLLLSGACMVASVTCVIVDYATTGGLSWSLIAIVSMALGWLLAFPFLKGMKKAPIVAGVILCLCIAPFLWALSLLVKEPLVFSLGKWMALVGLAWLGLSYGIFKIIRKSKWGAAGVCLIVLIPAQWLINYIIGLYITQAPGDWASNLLNLIILGASAGVCFSADYVKRKRALEKSLSASSEIQKQG